MSELSLRNGRHDAAPVSGPECRGARVLVLGVYLTDQPNNVPAIVRELGRSDRHHVEQRWVALGTPPPADEVAGVTVDAGAVGRPKFVILNELLDDVELDAFDFVLVCDDDITLPDRFLDRFLSLQIRAGLALAQPARTNDSYLDHPIVERQWGVAGRQTWFVEIGPVFCVHRSAYPLVFPFDLTSPMGWGYSNVWASLLTKRGLDMGIIDATPVAHNLRRPVAHYSWEVADTARRLLLERHPYYPPALCFRTLAVLQESAGRVQRYPRAARIQPVALSVVLPASDPESLERCLDSLVDATLPVRHFEVVVADRTPNGNMAAVCERFRESLDLVRLPLAGVGPAAAKHAAAFLGRGNILLLLDQGYTVPPATLLTHFEAHAENPDETVGVLGAARWGPGRSHSLLMRCMEHALGRLHRTHLPGEPLDSPIPLRGALSLKRSFMVRHGGFKQQLDAGLEETELQLRLARFGFQLALRTDAVTHRVEPPDLEAIVRHALKRGRARHRMASLYPDDAVRAFCAVDALADRWGEEATELESLLLRATELEQAAPAPIRPYELDEYTALYERICSIVEAGGVYAATTGAEVSTRIPGLPLNAS